MIGVVGILFAAYVADASYRNYYEQPMRLAEQRTNAAEKKLREAKLAVRREEKKLAQVDQLRIESLPPNLELAVSTYRAWLLRTIEQVGLVGSQVDSSPPVMIRDLFARIDFTVRGTGSLAQVTRFLEEFYRTACLHRIRSLTMTPVSGGAIDLSLTIETLSLPTASDEGFTAASQREFSEGETQRYRGIAQRDLFAAERAAGQYTSLTAITSDADQRLEAWFSLKQVGATRMVGVGESFEAEGLQVVISDISHDQVQLTINGEPSVMSVGMTLEEAQGPVVVTPPLPPNEEL